MEAGDLLMLQFKVLAVPTSEQRASKTAAKSFEALLNSYGEKGYRLRDHTLNGWAIMERETDAMEPEAVAE